MEEPEMQLKGKKGNARARARQRTRELAEGQPDRGREGTKGGRERKGQRLNCLRILVAAD